MKRNELQMYYAVLIINGRHEISLGKADLASLANREFAQIRNFNLDGKVDSITVLKALTKDDLNKLKNRLPDDESNLHPDQVFVNEMEKQFPGFKSMIKPFDPDEDSPYKGITMGELVEAQESEEYKLYNHFASIPDNRVGIDSSHIDSAQTLWRLKYPRIAEHIPKWID